MTSAQSDEKSLTHPLRSKQIDVDSLPPIQQIQDMLLVRLPRAICLYSSEAAPFLKALEHTVEALHRTRYPILGVLVLHLEESDDREISWLHELETSILFSSLVERIDSFRWILSLIRNSPKPWIFMSASNCLGSTWDLALSCQRRYWFDPNALVGYPEISSGGYPPGGVLESLSKRRNRTRERWLRKPIYTANEALSEGLVEFCSKASLWEKEAIAVFRELLQNQPSVGVREDPKKRRKRDAKSGDAFDLSRSILQRKAALEGLETVWRGESKSSTTYPHTWDYCWQLVQEKSRIEDPLMFGRLIAHIVARHYLTPGHLAWLRREIVASSDPCSVSELKATFRPEITVDLQTMAPPTEILLRLLKKGCSIVFSASAPRQLSTSLSLIYGRLERTLGAAIARKMWDISVSWYLCDVEPIGSIIMQWTPDDQFHIKTKDFETTFRRLQGNASNAMPGLIEWEGPELSDEIRHLLPLVSDGAIRVGSKSQGMPLSIFIRSIFLEEMIRISRHAEGELIGVTSAMRRHGWGFAADDEAWDRFLKTRYDQSHVTNKTIEEKPLLPLTKSSWEIGAWKHARALTKRKMGEMAFRRWNDTALSQHMASYLGVLTQILAKKVPLLPIITLDHLASEALGFPRDYGTPIGYIKRRGAKRTKAYTMLQWPMLANESKPQDP